MTARRFLAPAALLALATSFAHAADPMTFDFAKLPPDAIYAAAKGSGFEPGRAPAKPGDPFQFSVALPEGNYDVAITFGADVATSTSVKAESRRLMLERVETKPGETLTKTIAVHIHTPKIAGDGAVKLKDREKGVLHWDDKLTLEFIGTRVGATSVTITPSKAATLFIAGDSTVTDQPDEPWAGWGQLLPRFFKPDVAVANYAESGETLRAFRGEQRFAKILSQIHPGDWLLIQFGHNDMKEKGEGVGALTTFKKDLESYAAEAQKKGAKVVLVSPMIRRRFGPDGKMQATHGDYPEAFRQVAAEQKLPYIDLQSMSRVLFESMGADASKQAFVHYPANTFPGQAAALKDDTHFNNYGAYELARCVAEGLKTSAPELAAHLTNDVGTFDPAKPDDVAKFADLTSPSKPAATTKPDGN